MLHMSANALVLTKPTAATFQFPNPAAHAQLVPRQCGLPLAEQAVTSLLHACPPVPRLLTSESVLKFPVLLDIFSLLSSRCPLHLNALGFIC